MHAVAKDGLDALRQMLPPVLRVDDDLIVEGVLIRRLVLCEPLQIRAKLVRLSGAEFIRRLAPRRTQTILATRAAALSRRVNRLAAQDLCGARSEEQTCRRASWTFEERERLARDMLRSKD